MIALLLLAAQAGPTIEKVERVGIDVHRPLAWSPLAVTVTSATKWSGDLVVRSRFGFSTARRIDVPAGGLVREIVPGLDPDVVEAGASTARVPRAEARADLAVVVDAEAPYAGELVSGPRARFVKATRSDLRRMLAGGMLEGIDLLLTAEPLGPDAGAAPAWVLAPTRAEADRALAAAAPAPRLGAVDASAWRLAPSGGWVPAKRAAASLFAAAYALGGFGLLAGASRRGRRAFWGGAAAAVVLGLAAYGAFFTRGQVWVSEFSVETAGPGGVATERRIWFAGAATPSVTALSLSGLALPVFEDSSGAETPFTLRVQDGRCTVEGLALGPRRPVCFASFGAARARPGRRLRDAALSDGGRVRALGDLRVDDPVPAATGPAAAPAADPRRAPFERFLEGKALFGWLDGAGGRVADVASPDLADARAAARLYIRRLE